MKCFQPHPFIPSGAFDRQVCSDIHTADEHNKPVQTQSGLQNDEIF